MNEPDLSADERKAISRLPSFRSIAGNTTETVAILIGVALLLVRWAAGIGSIVTLGAMLLVFMGADLGLSLGQFFGWFVGFVAVEIFFEIIAHAMRSP